ncbi:hypothetical protein LXL04_037923 [Taraxacum kok-saghyz]
MKIFETRFLKNSLQGPNCDWIGWVNDHKCDCQYFTMKLEAENRNLKLFLIISWIFFVCYCVQTIDAVQLVISIICSNMTINFLAQTNTTYQTETTECQLTSATKGKIVFKR